MILDRNRNATGAADGTDGGMRFYLILFCLLVLTVSIPVANALAHRHGTEGGNADTAIEKFGTIHMPISCASSVQAPFERGVALLHSFWYEEATKQFNAIVAADPQCAMGHWGLAMAEWRPFWDGMPDDRRKAGIAEIDQAAALQPKTDREQRYVAALGGYLHGDPAHTDQALQDYNAAMAALTKAYPDDIEAQAFHGLGLAAATIGVADPTENARKALAVLEPGFQAHPDHPGFAHYIIHTCDSPQLAREALSAAEKYAAIAPSSAHALHMPGHIFARLGMWKEDIASNTASVQASEYAEAHHLGGVGHQMHADEFLLYAYLQRGDDEKAKQVRDLIEPLVAHLKALPGIADDDMAMFATYFQVELPSIYGLEMSDWKAVLAVPEPPQSLVSAKYYRVWARAIAAGHLRDADTADAAAVSAKSLYDATAAEGSPISLEIQAAQATIDAWRSFAHHDDAQALRKIGEAADIQDRVGQAEVDIPAREMYGDMLLIDERPAEALEQYRTALRLSPNRFNGLYHAGRAAEAAGKPAEAMASYKQLLTVIDGCAQSRRPKIVYSCEFVRDESASTYPE
jgi:tetratricopeptide (TPR) repeat protein